MKRILLISLLAACGGMGSSDDTGVDGSMMGSGSGSGSGSSGTDDRLYPLEVGRSWQYDVTSTYSSCPGGTREQRVVSKGMTDGRDTYEVQGFCGLTGHTNVAGNVVEEYFDWGPTGWLRSLDEPVSAGHTWTTTNGSATFSMTYSDAGNGCWKVTQNVSYTTYWIYCRGVGLTKYEMVDLAGGTIKAELKSKSF